MKKILSLGVVMAMFLGLTSCSIFQPYAKLSAKDKAIVTAEGISSWYYQTYKEIETKLETGTQAEKDYLIKNVNPKMNEIKPLIIKYDKLVSLWQTTGTKPENMEQLVDQIHFIMISVIQALQ